MKNMRYKERETEIKKKIGNREKKEGSRIQIKKYNRKIVYDKEKIAWQKQTKNKSL